jgi:hypothetical protein
MSLLDEIYDINRNDIIDALDESIHSICMAFNYPIELLPRTTIDLVEGQDYEIIKPKLLEYGNRTDSEKQ